MEKRRKPGENRGREWNMQPQAKEHLEPTDTKRGKGGFFPRALPTA